MVRTFEWNISSLFSHFRHLWVRTLFSNAPQRALQAQIEFESVWITASFRLVRRFYRKKHQIKFKDQANYQILFYLLQHCEILRQETNFEYSIYLNFKLCVDCDRVRVSTNPRFLRPVAWDKNWRAKSVDRFFQCVELFHDDDAMGLTLLSSACMVWLITCVVEWRWILQRNKQELLLIIKRKNIGWNVILSDIH